MVAAWQEVSGGGGSLVGGDGGDLREKKERVISVISFFWDDFK